MLEKAQTISDKWTLSEESLSSNSAALEWQEEWVSLGARFLHADNFILPTQVVASTLSRRPHLQQGKRP